MRTVSQAGARATVCESGEGSKANTFYMSQVFYMVPSTYSISLTFQPVGVKSLMKKLRLTDSRDPTQITWEADRGTRI